MVLDPTLTAIAIDDAQGAHLAVCALCSSRREMYIESPADGDWYGRGEVWRIGCVCDAAMELEKDDTRTEFERPAEAVRQWNEMQAAAAVPETGC